MSSLFRSLNHFSSKRENVVKGALINTLNENAREIEFEVKQKSLGEFHSLKGWVLPRKLLIEYP